MVQGRLEITIKISDMPIAKEVENSWKQFEIDCDGRVVQVTVKPKQFKKLEQAQADYPQWVAAIAGKMGASTPNGFILDGGSIQVFERKPKES
ncbi:MAG: fertility inhibition FinO-like protein [Elainellaceae cyanobacterium]